MCIPSVHVRECCVAILLIACIGLPFLSQSCPVETPDFRAEQCSNYNNRSIFGGPTNWKPTEEGTLVVSCIGLTLDQLEDIEI